MEAPPHHSVDRGSKLDEEVFRRYEGNQAALKRRAAQLRSIVAHQDGIPSLETVHDEEVPDEVVEGKTVFKLHRTRERDTRITRKKKKDVLEKTGRMECEACGFDFQSTYGELGEGFCEVHHRTPLAELDGETKTTLKGLAVVCANCHRMLHRMTDMSVQGLKDILAGA